MRTSPVIVVVAFFASALTASGQSTWDKTYSIKGRASLQVSVDVASLVVRTCGDCRTVRIHVDAHDTDLSRWRVTEMQGGDTVHFDLKRRDSDSFFQSWTGRSPEVIVDLPTESDIELHSGNGSVQLSGVHGAVDARTGNGAMQADDLKGSLHLSSGNGVLTVHRADGTLNAVSGNGALTVEGRLSQMEVRSGNGNVHLELEPGTTLSSSSRVTTGHGGITMVMPRDLKAEIDLSTGNGSLHSDLPLLTDASGDHHLHGSVNGGGAALSLHSGNGGITLNAR